MMREFYTLLAAFSGSIIACSYLPTYSALSVLIGLFVHVATGYYVATLLVAYSHLDGATQPGFAFVFALTAKNLLLGIMRLSDHFRRHPAWPPIMRKRP